MFERFKDLFPLEPAWAEEECFFRATVPKGGGVILALDPGTEITGWALYSNGAVCGSGVLPNAEMLAFTESSQADTLAIEMIQAMGMIVGREVFETCVWIGRFQQAWRAPEAVRLVYRGQVKQFLCRSAWAKDPNIRQALIDLLGPPGVKAKPGPTYGVRSHAWSALAVAVTAAAMESPDAIAPGLFAAAKTPPEAA